MNRLKSLQSYPVLYRVFYLESPAVFVFFTFAILVSCFGFSLQEACNYWAVPALIGVAFMLYAFYHTVFVQENQNPIRSKQDIKTTPEVLKGKLDTTYRSIRYVIICYIGVLGGIALIRLPFSPELGQMADLLAVCCFFAMGSYFREILRVYLRITKVSDEEMKKSFAQGGAFPIIGWIAVGVFFSKVLRVKGEMGWWWSGLSNFQFSNILLVIALVVYLAGVFGLFFSMFTNRENSQSSGFFNSCIAFGSTFPLAWLYYYVHPHLFIDISSWLIQFPILGLVFLTSSGVYLSSQSGLGKEILGRSCLWFVRYATQILAFILLWAISVLYADMNPEMSAILYGGFFAFVAWIENRAPNLVVIITVFVIGPLLSKMIDCLLK